MNPVVTQDWLREHLDDPEVRVVDCRFAHGNPEAGHDAYLRGHIPGAAFVDLDADLAGPVGDGRRGRHPLPEPGTFTESMRAAGVHPATIVVTYDEGRSGGAARLWWLLRHFGHEEVAVLDGGLAGWGGPVEQGELSIPRGTWSAGEARDDTVDAETIERGGTTLVDARAPERHRGEVEPIDAVAGRIPGARNAPYTEPVPEEIVAADGEIAVYCGSGVTACVVLHDLAVRGRIDAKLYPGSYSEWSTRGLPIERG